jgi:hypothetical protein
VAGALLCAIALAPVGPLLQMLLEALDGSEVGGEAVPAPGLPEVARPLDRADNLADLRLAELSVSHGS